MELVFIHGWGFDARFWDALGSLLSQYKQQRVDLGFLSSPYPVPPQPGQILIGHSLGFMHGIEKNQNWAGWVAINSFPRFCDLCVPKAILREMRARLIKDTPQTLQDFYELIHAQPPGGAPDIELLLQGLDDLRDADISDMLKAIDKPHLTLASRLDPLVPVHASEMLGNVVWHEGGHTLPQSDPAWCADQIDQFVKQNFS